MLRCANAKCGVQSENKAYFCWKCGHRLRLDDPTEDTSQKEKSRRFLRSIKVIGIAVFLSILIVGFGIYWCVRTHPSAQAQSAKSARNGRSTPSGMPSVSGDGRDPVTTRPAIPGISHQPENIPRPGVATTKTPAPPIFPETRNPRPAEDHRPATTKPPVPQPASALNEPARLQAVLLKPVDTHGMVRIPRGEFKMGSPGTEPGRFEIESPQHSVSVETFMMDETEVTNEMYKRFVLDRPDWQKGRVAANLASQYYLKNWEGTEYPANQDKYPVAGVSWYAARAFCEWENKRLPTEAEWEYTARAETTTAFWWGPEWNGLFANGSKQSAESVGNPAHRNKFGLFDMLGNVYEWTSTVYEPYPYDSKDGREDQKAKEARVLRGGSWSVDWNYLRSATRVREPPEFTREDVGFRCAY